MTSRLGRLAGALSLLALLVLVAAGLAGAAAPPGTPITVGLAAPGKVHRVGQSGPGGTAAPTNGTRAIGYRLTAKLTPASGAAAGQWDGVLVHTVGVVRNGAMPSIPGCSVTGPRAGGPGQSPPRASGRPHVIKCGGPGAVPPFSVPGTGTHWILGWKMTFSGLTGAVTGTVLQLNSPGTAGIVASTLCSPCTSGKFGRTTLTDDQAHAVLAGQGYVVVETAANPSGEISGQITKAAAPTAPTAPTATGR
jgi:hypothetical protein